MTRHVVFLVLPGTQLLDLAGPADVFVTANECRREAGHAPPYRITFVGPVPEADTATGVGLRVRDLGQARGNIDTLVVPGGIDFARTAVDARTTRWLRRRAGRARRVASICTGAFVLARAGMLTGRRVTTHWRALAELRTLAPAASVEEDPLYIKDGSVYTSAGITAGIDLAVTLVEEDLGAELALEVARTRPCGADSTTRSACRPQSTARASGARTDRAVGRHGLLDRPDRVRVASSIHGRPARATFVDPSVPRTIGPSKRAKPHMDCPHCQHENRESARFVGRAADLHTLDDATERAAAGEAPVVGVVAEAGRAVRYLVRYGNRGNTDAFAVPLTVGAPEIVTVAPRFEILPPPQQAGKSAVKEFGRFYQSIVAGEGPPLRQLMLLLPVVPAGFAGALEVTLTVPAKAAITTLPVRVEIGTPRFNGAPRPEAVAALVAGARAKVERLFKRTLPTAHDAEMTAYVGTQLRWREGG